MATTTSTSTTETRSRSSTSSLVIFSILIVSLFLFLHSSTAYKPEDNDIADGEEYEVDYPFPDDPKGKPRGPKQKIKKGEKCYPWRGNICNGIKVNDGAGILQCCRKQCVNLLADPNNCGGCGKTCGFGQQCCAGFCTNVISNAKHCGTCFNQCSPATKCDIGLCGYA
ncbi:hypothetical protein MKW98_024647 [Papaver atlanticum]|uniref:Uncharacterized protein n=1 Tax=Papaver atlanticum TaxID=357466 RepID=A0AAD4X6H1_9MAGN|nr:hypothetical protein MKW98_024647 [Papaver atlanticum]